MLCGRLHGTAAAAVWLVRGLSLPDLFERDKQLRLKSVSMWVCHLRLRYPHGGLISALLLPLLLLLLWRLCVAVPCPHLREAP